MPISLALEHVYGVALCLALYSSQQLCSSLAEDLQGHLQSLGFHKAATYQVDEQTDAFAVRPAEFYTKYVLAGRPAVFRGAAKHFEAFRKWRADRFKSEPYAELAVKVERIGPWYTKMHHGQAIGVLGLGRDTLAGFAEKINSPSSEIVSELPSPMYADVALLPCMSCGTLAKHISHVLLHVGSGGRTDLERTSHHIMHCQLNGTQDWILVPGDQADNAYLESNRAVRGRTPSAINVDSVNLTEFEQFRDVPWGLVVLQPGDCLFVPARHLYQVRKYGLSNMAVALDISNDGSSSPFDASGCKEGVSDFATLDEVQDDILWVYPGSGTMTLSREDEVAITNAIKALSSNGKPTLKDFQRIIPKEIKESSKEYKARIESNEKAFKLLNQQKPEDDVITDEDLKLVTRAQWREISRLLFPDDDLTDMPFLEYGILEYPLVFSVIRQAFETHSFMDRESFLDLYTKVLQGSHYIGEKLFDQMDTNKNNIINRKIFRGGRLERALQPFLEHSDGEAEDEELYDLGQINQILVGDEDTIQNDETISEYERDSATEWLGERQQVVESMLGSEDDGEDDGDSAYEKHLQRLKAEELQEQFPFDEEGLQKYLEEQQKGGDEEGGEGEEDEGEEGEEEEGEEERLDDGKEKEIEQEEETPKSKNTRDEL